MRARLGVGWSHSGHILMGLLGPGNLQLEEKHQMEKKVRTQSVQGEDWKRAGIYTIPDRSSSTVCPVFGTRSQSGPCFWFGCVSSQPWRRAFPSAYIQSAILKSRVFLKWEKELKPMLTVSNREGFWATYFSAGLNPTSPWKRVLSQEPSPLMAGRGKKRISM